MIYRILLFTRVTDRPKWWKNFCESLDPLDDSLIMDTLESQSITLATDNDLPPYGNRYLDFPDEKTYTMFLLKWS